MVKCGIPIGLVVHVGRNFNNVTESIDLDLDVSNFNPLTIVILDVECFPCSKFRSKFTSNVNVSFWYHLWNLYKHGLFICLSIANKVLNRILHCILLDDSVRSMKSVMFLCSLLQIRTVTEYAEEI